MHFLLPFFFSSYFWIFFFGDDLTKVVLILPWMLEVENEQKLNNRRCTSHSKSVTNILNDSRAPPVKSFFKCTFSFYKIKKILFRIPKCIFKKKLYGTFFSSLKVVMLEKVQRMNRISNTFEFGFWTSFALKLHFAGNMPKINQEDLFCSLHTVL